MVRGGRCRRRAALWSRRGSDHDADHGVVRIVDVGRCEVVQQSWCQRGDCQLQSVVGELTARGGTLSKEGPPVAVCSRRKGHNRLWQGPVSKGQPHVVIVLLEEATSRSQQGRCWSVQEEAICIFQHFECATDPAHAEALRSYRLANVFTGRLQLLGRQLAAGGAAAATTALPALLALADDEARRARAVATLGAAAVAVVESELLVAEYTRSGDDAATAALRKKLLGKLLKKQRAARRAAAVRPSAGSSAGGKRKRGWRPRCYTCNKRGHIAANCTAGGGSDDSSSGSSS